MFAADEQAFVISNSGDLLQMNENYLNPSPLNALRGVSLKIIVCSGDYSLLLGTDGLVMFMGKDT